MIIAALILSLTMQAAPPASAARQALAQGGEYLKNSDNEKALAAFECATALDAKNPEPTSRNAVLSPDCAGTRKRFPPARNLFASRPTIRKLCGTAGTIT
jgi:hypothetical protein